MKRLSWKYIAGLIDGEGCIDFQCHTDNRANPPRLYIIPRLRIGMTVTAKDLLDTLKNNLGGNVWPDNRKHNNPNWLPAYTWQEQGKRLRPILQNVVNHLFLKQEQARLCIWWIDRCMGRPFSKLNQIEKIRKGARDELKAMKTDPHRLSGRAVSELTKLIESETDAIVEPSVSR